MRTGEYSSVANRRFLGFFFKVKIPRGNSFLWSLKMSMSLEITPEVFWASWFLWSLDLNKSNFLMFGPLCMSINPSLFSEDLLWWGVAQWDSRWEQNRQWGAYAIKMNNEQKQTSCKSSIWREVGRTWAEPNTGRPISLLEMQCWRPIYHWGICYTLVWP